MDKKKSRNNIQDVDLYTDLTNYGQKNSIINIQDLSLSAASQHFVGGQPILRDIFRKLYIFRKFLFLEKLLYLTKFSIFRKFVEDIGGQPIP
jgi:hypothetical protein